IFRTSICAHFVLNSTSLQLIPAYSSQSWISLLRGEKVEGARPRTVRQILANQSKSGRAAPQPWSVEQQDKTDNNQIFRVMQSFTALPVSGIEPAVALG